MKRGVWDQSSWKAKLDAQAPEGWIPLSEFILREARWVQDCFHGGYLFKLPKDDLEDIVTGGGFPNWREKYGELVWLLMRGTRPFEALKKVGLIRDIKEAETIPRKWAFALYRMVQQGYGVFCLAAYSKPLRTLVREATGGNDASFYRLVQLDKGILASPWAAARICEAQLNGDKAFFGGLADALKKHTFTFHQKKEIQLAFFLYRNWDCLQFLRNREILDLLDETRLPGFTDVMSLGRFIHRLGLKRAREKPEVREEEDDMRLSPQVRRLSSKIGKK